MCDKCGLPVPKQNDAVWVHSFAYPSAVLLALGYPRHFLPVVEEGVQVCEGSPSRAQYIEGQPRDARGYGYYPEDEARWRRAFAQLQAECASEAANA